MNTILTIKPRLLQDLINCEMGAHDDGLTGPSPLTTVTILERHPNQIELRSVEEAAQVYDALLYGTYPLEHPSSAERLADQIIELPGVKEVWRKHNEGQWDELAELIKNAQEGK